MEPPDSWKPGEQRSRDAEMLGERHVQLYNIREDEQRAIGQRFDRSPTSVVALLVSDQDPPQLKSTIGVGVGRLFGGVGLLFSLVLAALVTFLALVVEIYPGGAFGTFEDYTQRS